MNFKKVRFKVITDDNVRLQAFLKGEFDYMNLQSYQYDEIRKNPGKQKYVLPVHLEPKVNTSFMFISWNSRLPIFADVKTRHALSLLADRFSVLDKFSRGLRPPTNGPWGKMSPFSCPESECPVIPFDVKKGKKLLKEAGWKDSDGDGVLDRTIDGKKQKLAFTILAGQGDYSRNLLGVYATEYKKAGIDAKVKQLDWTAMNKLVDDLKFQAFLSGFQAGYPMIPRQLWHSENAGKTGSNSWGFKNKKADKLIVQFEKEFNPKKRIQIARKIHKIIYNNHPCMFHHEGGGCYAGKNKSLEGFEVANYSTNCLYWPRWYKKAGAKSAAAADSVEAAGSTSCCSTWLIIALIAGLGIVGFVIRKKKKA